MRFNAIGFLMTGERKAFQLTGDLVAAARAAAPAGVVTQLSEYDQLLGFLIGLPGRTAPAAVEAYFAGGAGDAQRLVAILDQLDLLGKGTRVLEFAAGYGRVTRHLLNLLPGDTLAACDIHPAAYDLLQSAIGVRAYQSTTVPEDLAIAEKQDFVFALSLFSHLPLATQGRWVKQLYGLLAPGGYLMFTTHGEFAMRKLPDFFDPTFERAKGFGYQSASDQADLSSADYGTAVVTMPFVYDLVSDFVSGAEIVSFRSGAWFELQDEWIVRKPVEQAATA